MGSELLKSTVYFDGSCPLCRAENGYYRGKDRAGALCFVDVSEPGAKDPEGITKQRAGNGQIMSGAAAFVEVWARLPGWHWAARGAALPGALTVLEFGYRLFLPVRPFISRVFGAIQRRGAAGDGAKRG